VRIQKDISNEKNKKGENRDGKAHELQIKRFGTKPEQNRNVTFGRHWGKGPQRGETGKLDEKVRRARVNLSSEAWGKKTLKKKGGAVL